MVHELFRAPQTDVVVVRPNVDISPFQIRIAELEGTVRGYEKGIAKLTAVAKQNKDLSERRGALMRLFKGTLQELIAKGLISKQAILEVQDEVEKRLPTEDRVKINNVPV